jgi:hypothetical protein
MSPAEAAREFWDTVEAVTAHKPVAKRHSNASDVLKKHMVDKDLTTYQGIHLTEIDAGERLDVAAARAKFGDKLADCMVPSKRRSLIPVKRPKSLSSS